KLPDAPTGFVTFLTMIVPRWRLVNVQVTVSPGSSLNVAVRVARLTVLAVALAPSLHEMPVRSNAGAGFVSVDVYVPGTRLPTVMVPPSLIVPAASPVNVKLPDAPTGLVTFLTMI